MLFDSFYDTFVIGSNEGISEQMRLLGGLQDPDYQWHPSDQRQGFSGKTLGVISGRDYRNCFRHMLFYATHAGLSIKTLNGNCGCNKINHGSQK
jgi:hypothetical protein